MRYLIRRGVVVFTSIQLHLTNPELKFCAGLIHACGMLEILNGWYL